MTGLHDHDYVRVAAVEAGQRAKARISEAALRSAGLADCERRCRKIRRRFDEELQLIREVARHAGPAPPSQSKRFTVEIVKALPDKMQVFGWASVCTRGGRHVIDKQDDIVPVEALEPAVYDYVLNSRDGGDMHIVKGVSRCIESVMFTKEKQKALGIDLGLEGWWVGFAISDPVVWAAVKAGRRPQFSIGGSAVAKELKLKKLTKRSGPGAGRGGAMTRVLGKIKLSEVSLVDSGAGDGVDVKLLKRANARAAARHAALDRFHRRVAKAQSEAVDRSDFILRYSKARQKFDEELEDLVPAKANSKEGKKSRRADALSQAPSANRSLNPRPAVIGHLGGSYDPVARPQSALRSFSDLGKAADDNTIYDTICALAAARQRPNETPESALARFVSAAPGMLNAMRGTAPPSPLGSSLSKRLLFSVPEATPTAVVDAEYSAMMAEAERIAKSTGRDPAVEFARLYESPRNIALRKSKPPVGSKKTDDDDAPADIDFR